MMGTKTFRSEEEQLRSLCDETQGPYPLFTREDPVIFHNDNFERELFMEYNLDFGGESPCSSQQQPGDEELFVKEEKLEPSWYLPSSEIEDPTNSPPTVNASSCSPPALIQTPKPSKMPTRHVLPPRYNPYTSGPLVKEPCNSRSRGNSMHMVYRSESPTNSKRGRPSKTTSNSKMANYARNYREMKKNEMATMQMRNQELEAELKLLHVENAKMKKALIKANDEVNQLKKVIDQDSQIARVVANMGGQSSSSSPADYLGGRAGVCVHVGHLGTTVEVCKQCADNNQLRLDSKMPKFDDLGATELFNGDFSAFESYLNGTC